MEPVALQVLVWFAILGLIVVLFGVWRMRYRKVQDSDEVQNSDNADDLLNRLKTGIEIIAILIASLVAYFKFVYVDADTLKSHLRFQSNFTSDYLAATNTCLSELVLTAMNTSKRSLQVDSVRVWAGMIAAPRAGKGIQQFESIENAWLKLEPTTYRSDKKLAFIYPPERDFTDSFTWIHPPAADSLLVVRLRFYAVGKPLDDRYEWKVPCTRVRNQAENEG